jgi:hypothetical protein
MAAAVLDLGPNTNLDRANTAKIVDQVLRWLGVRKEEMNLGWERPKKQPINDEVYNVLVFMTRQARPNGSWRKQQRAGKPLFEGSGNWGVPGDPECPPCWPHYNSCRLTVHGEQIARQLLVSCELRLGKE